jgi:hypothetical protein
MAVVVVLQQQTCVLKRPIKTKSKVVTVLKMKNNDCEMYFTKQVYK